MDFNSQLVPRCQGLRCVWANLNHCNYLYSTWTAVAFQLGNVMMQFQLIFAQTSELSRNFHLIPFKTSCWRKKSCSLFWENLCPSDAFAIPLRFSCSLCYPSLHLGRVFGNKILAWKISWHTKPAAINNPFCQPTLCAHVMSQKLMTKRNAAHDQPQHYG